jgi:hypothetical protein
MDCIIAGGRGSLLGSAADLLKILVGIAGEG